MMLLLLKLIGVERVAGWVARLVKIALWVILAVFLILALVLGGPEMLGRVLGYMSTGLIIWGVQALWRRRRRRKAEPVFLGERTIDGKVVPEKLAAAALEMPPYSPDGDFVLRGLPDYGKTLLKLDSEEFQYPPRRFPTSPAALLELPEEKAPEEHSHLVTLRWVLAGVVAVIVLVAASAAALYAGHDRAASQATSVEQPGPSASTYALPDQTPLAGTPLSAPSPAALSDPSQSSPAVETVQPTASRQVYEDSDAHPLELLTSVDPVYPLAARFIHTREVTKLRAIIGTNGRVESVTVISGPEMLRSAATEAVKKYTYKPYLVNGEPQRVETTIFMAPPPE